MRYLNIILLLLVIFSCKKDNSFIAKGKVLNRDSGIVRFSQLGVNYFDADIYELTNEEFYFKGEIDSPEKLFIQHKTNNTPTRYEPERYYLHIEPGSTTEIVLNTENVSKSEFIGSKTGREYLKFQQVLFDEFDSKRQKLSDEYQNAQKINDKELIDKIVKKDDSMINEKQNWELRYMESSQIIRIS